MIPSRNGGGQSHVDACGQGKESKTLISLCAHHKWMTPNATIYVDFVLCFSLLEG